MATCLANAQTHTSNSPFGTVPNSQTTTLPATSKPLKRTFGLGLQLQSTERSESMSNSYDRIKDAAEISYMQRNWDEWQNKRTISYDEIPFARSKGLKIYVALDLLSYDNPRADLLLANKKTGFFTDAKVKADYLALVQEIAARCKPEYFILLVESNLYKDKNPADYEAFKRLYPEAVALVRKYSPATKLGVSITYGDHNGHDGIDAEDDAYFKKCVADFDENSDMLSVSTYPFFYLNPHFIPTDFLNRMASFSKKPLFISETSWVSEPFDIDLPGGKKFKFKSNPDTQAEYFLKLCESADYALLQKRRIEAINFVSLNDPKPISAAVFKLINAKFAWFCSLAVSENSGKPKPAYEFMKAWKSR